MKSVVLVSVIAFSLAQHRGLYSGLVSDFEVTFPEKISPGGISLGTDVSHYHNATGRPRRSRRHVPADTLHYRLNVSGRPEVLDLEPSTSFVVPRLWVQRGLRVSRMAGHKTRCHYRGVVRHHRMSSVALSTCKGLAGVVRMAGVEYWLEPTTEISGITAGSQPHILFRRAAPLSNTRHWKKRKKKRRKKHEKNCGTKEPLRLKEQGWWKRGKRSISKQQYVEALLVADASMVEYHQDGDVETYLLTIMNMVSSLYQDPSIGNSINIMVVKVVLIEENAAEGLNITVNADHSLVSFCEWQEKLNPASETDPQHHDVAILITRKDICSRQNKPCRTLGVSHVAGMCDPARSCNINEDNGITLAHTIAHELGHNFGMFHDSPKTGCTSRRGSTLHVMTPTFEADSLTIAWSECSRRDITHFLDQGLGACLEDQPEHQGDYNYPELPAGAMYNADYQCRLQFGPESSVCSTEEICSRLWCKVDGACSTNLYPAAPGTHCDKHMWCVDQTCVQIGENAEPIDGGWGEWGEWSKCSRTCGAGVSIKERFCDHPTPAFGGRYCLGERRRYQVCNVEPCPESPFSFRAEQCSSYNNKPYFGNNYTWLPYFEISEPCDLYCTDTEDTVVANLRDAIDGTPCNLGTRDMCVSGICQKVGCDWMVNSEAVEDKCGVCRGNGTMCITEKGYYNISHGDGYKRVVVILQGARNIRVEEVSGSSNYISIKSATSSKYYLNGNGEMTSSGEYTVAGSAALYKHIKEADKLRIPGPIKEDILVYLVFRDKNPGLYFEFTQLKDHAKQMTQYQWQTGEWSTCSVTCGGGEQVLQSVCYEIDKGMSAPGKCSLDSQPPEQRRACNLHPCPVRWWIGPWQLCPVTCGELALRKRSVICVSGSKELALPDVNCEGQMRPPDQEPCPDIPPCLTPTIFSSLSSNLSLAMSKSLQLLGPDVQKLHKLLDNWTALPWSQCSVTCGVGFKKRTIFCASQNCDPHTKPISVKQCFRHCPVMKL